MAEKEKVFTIKTAAKELGLSEVYIRRAVRSKDLATQLVPVSKGSKTERHEIKESILMEWRATRGSGSRREDGRNKFVLYANSETELGTIKEAIAQALPDYPVEDLIVRANPSKSK